MTDQDLRAAVAAGVLGAEDSYRALLRSIVETGPGNLRGPGVVDLPSRRDDR